MNTLVISETRKSLSVECCLETKMRRAVQLLYDVMADTIGYIQIKMGYIQIKMEAEGGRDEV